MNLIMYESNIYVNNSKIISIVDNVSVLQLPPGPFYTVENYPRVESLIVSCRQCGALSVILKYLIG